MSEARSFRDPQRQDDIEKRRQGRRFRSPVGWLMDQQLAVNLQAILRYSAAGEAIDPRSWMVPRELSLIDKDEPQDEYWFDYLSDTGDGMKATYGVASLVHSDLYVPAGCRPGDRVYFPFAQAPGQRQLPRGGLLVIGGDTAYQIADYETLVERFQRPFNWAFRDLELDGAVENEPRRPIVAIPANHDYYDFLDGFNRQFRRPFNDERRWNPDVASSQPLLVLDGFKRVQWASYFSVALPCGWRIFGFDSQGGKMDKRQKHFFRDIIEDPEKPTDKLIIATPEPTTVLGKRCDDKAPIVETLRDVLRDEQSMISDDSCPFLAERPDTVLRTGQCRLDLSGDIHQYACHWGADAGAEPGASYASVVSGLGGAFLHPTSTDAGEVETRAIFPPRGAALGETVRRCLNPWNVMAGGRVWLIGLVVALILFVGTIASTSVRHELGKLPIGLPALATDAEDLGTAFLAMLRDSLRVPRLETDPATQLAMATEGLFHQELLFLPVLLGVAGLGVWWNSRRKLQSLQKGEPDSPETYRWPIWALVVASGFAGWWIFGHDPGGTTDQGRQLYKVFRPLYSNLVVLGLGLVAFLGLTWCRQYDEAMLRQARKRRLGAEDQIHLWLLWAFTTLSLFLGLTRYGVDSLAVVTTDLAFLLVVLAGSLGLVYFASAVGGHLLGGLGKLMLGLFGILHAALQLGAPILLALKLPPVTAFAIALATALFAWLVGRFLPLGALAGRGARSERRRLGVVLLVLGLAWIALVVYVTEAWPDRPPVTGWTLVVALVLGAILSCVSLGWYLAVALCFDAHNGEAGGAARIEKYKQFLRIRVTQGGLTAYVIGFEEPKERYEELEPRLTDVFELRTKGG